MKTGKQLSEKLPEYPRTPHLPHKPNMAIGDIVSTKEETSFLFTSPSLLIEEKIDGANCAIMWNNGEIIVRNREHILNKGYLKNTPAKIQFRSLWTWVYDHRDQFIAVEKELEGAVGIYGEWCWALHGIIYDKLPAYFIPWGIYDPQMKKMISANLARNILENSGFFCPSRLHIGPIESWEWLEHLCDKKSLWGPEKIEGIYIKDSEAGYVKCCYKMVRPDFKQGCRWSTEMLTKQALQKR